MKTRSLENIKAETDDTDHFWFVCPDCGVRMKVSDGYNRIVGFDKTITTLILKCPTCGGSGVRKIVWG